MAPAPVEAWPLPPSDTKTAEGAAAATSTWAQKLADAANVALGISTALFGANDALTRSISGTAQLLSGLTSVLAVAEKAGGLGALFSSGGAGLGAILPGLGGIVGGLGALVAAFGDSPAERERLREAMSYPEDTVGALMDFDMISIRDDVRLEVVLRYLRRLDELPDHTDQLFVVDRRAQFRGLLPVNRLLVTDPETIVGEVMVKEQVRLHPDDKAQDAAAAFERYDLVSAPVVDDAGRLIGRVTVAAHGRHRGNVVPAVRGDEPQAGDATR